MWKCPKCGEEIRDSFDSCWNCGTSQDGSPPVDADVFNSLKEETAKSDNYHARYTTTYATARLIAQFVSFVGWAAVTISAMILVVSLAKSKGSGSVALLGLLPSFSGLISGLLLVMFGQLTRATLDNADNTGQMLALMKKRKVNKAERE